MLGLMVVMQSILGGTMITALSATTPVGITSDMLEPVVDVVLGNIAVIVPVGILLFGTMLGLGLVTKLLKRFAK